MSCLTGNSSHKPRRNAVKQKKCRAPHGVLHFLVEATGLEPTTFWSLRHNRKFFIYFPDISKSFVSATDAFLYSCSHCFHVVQIRKWSNMWSFRFSPKRVAKNQKRHTHVRIYSCTGSIAYLSKKVKCFADFLSASLLKCSFVFQFCTLKLHLKNLNNFPFHYAKFATQ